MDVREKLMELILNADNDKNLGSYDLYELTHERTGCAEYFADYLIAHGVTVQEWISVNDRLPEDYSPVLVYKSRHSESYGNMGTAYYWNQSRWMGCIGETVTHWMPLPQPPKGE